MLPVHRAEQELGKARPARYLSFRRKLSLCFILCASLPLVLVGLLAFHTANGIARDKTLESIFLTGRQVALSVNTRLQQIEHVADSIQYNLYTLESTPATPYSDYLKVAEQVKTSIASLSHAFGAVHATVFLDSSRLVSNERYTFYPLEDVTLYGATQEELLAAGTQSLWLFAPRQEYPYAVSNDAVPSVTCFRAKTDVHSQGIAYAYAVSLSCAEFDRMLSDVYADSGVSGCLLEVESGRYIASTDGPWEIQVQALEQIRGGNRSFRFRRDQYQVHPTNNGRWVVVTRVSDDYIRESAWVLVSIITVGFASVLAITLFVTIFVSRTLTRRLNRLAEVISRAGAAPDGEYLAQLQEAFPADRGPTDEIDLLAGTYTTMIRTILESFQQILDMKVNEERLKYQLLQSQINPHFLYNMLQSIQTCQTAGRIDSANRMTSGLAKFYRHILRKQDDMIPIAEEVATLRLYMEMEAFCHSNDLEWSVHMEEGIERFRICRFILQPVVENCIVHGIRSAAEKITVRITFTYGEDAILIRVEDDGLGMSPDKLASLRETLAEGKADYSRHFGLGNVAVRLASVRPGYGTIAIDSREGGGTAVTITVQQIL